MEFIPFSGICIALLILLKEKQSQPKERTLKSTYRLLSAGKAGTCLTIPALPDFDSIS